MRLAFLAATLMSSVSLSAQAVTITMPNFYFWPADDAIVSFASMSAPATVNALETIADGNQPDLGSDWQSQTWWTDSTAEIRFVLPGLFELGNIGLLYDNNDDYTLYGSADGQTWELIASFAATGPVDGGMTAGFTLASSTPPSYRELKLTASGGDGMYGIGEIAFAGVSAVPETGSFAMMLAGLALITSIARRRT